MPLARRIGLWAPPLLLMAVIFVLSAQPSLDTGLGLIDTIGRKLIHAGEYALLTALWWRALREGLDDRRAALAGFLIASVYAMSDELHQSFVDGRHGSPVDWLIDTAGAGLAAWYLGSRRRIRA